MRTGPMPVAATGLVLGWLADRVIGDPVRGHPVAGFGRLAQGLERLAWRPARLPGVLPVAVHGRVDTVDGMVRHRNERYEHFGWGAARLDDGLPWPAARLAAWLAVLLAPVAGGDRSRAWATLRRDGAAHPSPNAGRLEAAFARAPRPTPGGGHSHPRPPPRPPRPRGRPPPRAGGPPPGRLPPPAPGRPA